MARFKPSISDEFIELRPPKFHPYAFIQTAEYMPISIAMAAGGGRRDEIHQPVRDVRRCRSAEGAADRPGALQGERRQLQPVVAYLFVFTPTEGILLDVDGNVIGHRSGKVLASLAPNSKSDLIPILPGIWPNSQWVLHEGIVL
jgi:hypothetical protein